MAETFADVIDAIFAKLAVRYGAEWLRKWEGVDIAAVKADWGYELGGFGRDLEPLRYALRNLPDKCPNVQEFRAIARRMPPPEFKQLPAPKADQEKVAAEIAKQIGLKAALAPKGDMKDWARSIVKRAEAGEKIRPYTLLSARQALGMEGKMSWQ